MLERKNPRVWRPLSQARPVLWFKTLVNSQHHAPILALESSTRAKLGFAVERLCRGLSMVAAINDDSEEVRPAFVKNKWTTKALVREGATALAGPCSSPIGASRVRACVHDIAKRDKPLPQTPFSSSLRSQRSTSRTSLPVYEKDEGLDAGC